jgi:hypothetical protein
LVSLSVATEEEVATTDAAAVVIGTYLLSVGKLWQLSGTGTKLAAEVGTDLTTAGCVGTKGTSGA